MRERAPQFTAISVEAVDLINTCTRCAAVCLRALYAKSGTAESRPVPPNRMVKSGTAIAYSAICPCGV
eukprot:638881-Rhodomonas_salina.2